MTVKRITAPAGRHYTAQSAQDCVGAAQVVICEQGVSVGHVAAVNLVAGGVAVDLVIEYDRPVLPPVPNDVCARVGACRWDMHCPFWDTCARHVHGPDCGGCQ